MSTKASMRFMPAFLRPRRKHKPNLEAPLRTWNIVTGDKVIVNYGPCKGQQGTVLEVIRKSKRIVVDGVNLRVKNLKKKYWEEKGTSIMAPASLHYSNVNLVDPVSGLPTRVGTGYLDDGTKVRIAKRSGAIIPKPVFQRHKPMNLVAGPLDTSPEDVMEVTYNPDQGDLPMIPNFQEPAEDPEDVQIRR
uniref:Large ribosomal subunit protein uL24c n=1 Tax=Rhizochromulina marina TaxID=1034831 RepID=A0A7S2WGF6_9STRA|mmetsp:Transcript_23677/g.69294  ORF Transcript_23677/g.69294 Transcript_23677/m.69294 type:complete len:190 (+) Transcript_23677:36-605(+)